MVAEKLPSHQRKKAIIKIIKEIGLGNIHYPTLGTQYGVSHQQIAKDVKLIMRDWQETSINLISNSMEIFYEKGIKDFHKLANHENPSIRQKAIQTGLITQKEYRDHLESFGKKAKVADKVQVAGVVANIGVKEIIESFEQKEENQQ